MPDSPSVPPSVQAWDEARETISIDGDCFAGGCAIPAGDALRAEVLRLTEELDAALEEATETDRSWAAFHQGTVEAYEAALMETEDRRDYYRRGRDDARAENLRLREALERITTSISIDAPYIAAATLGSVSSEPPRETSHFRNGARMSCGCWWHAPPGSQAGRKRATCPTHGTVMMETANVDCPLEDCSDEWLRRGPLDAPVADPPPEQCENCGAAGSTPHESTCPGKP